MNETANNGGNALPEADNGATSRVFRIMVVVVILAVLGSATLGNWRFTTGLLLGGLLSLLNYRWMSSSIFAAFRHAAGFGVPKVGLAKYLLRYFVIGSVVFIAAKLNLVSLPATIVGLSSFVVALFAEAAREFYFVIFPREETS